MSTLAPQWLVHRYDETHDALHLIEVDRATRAGVPFLVDRDLPPRQPVIASRTDILARAPEPAPLHFVFHSAFCCSTLMVKALDRVRVASTLSEPQLLADMVGWRHRGGPPAQIGAVLNDALALLARPFENGEAVVVKPSNVCNGLAQAMMNIRPEACAILMHAPLPVFLTSIARKGMWGRLWARELLSKQLADGYVELGFEARDYLLHTDLQAAAVGWLAQKRLFATMAARWPERVRTLDSEVFVARPHEALAAASTLFGLALGPRDIAEIVAIVFARNTKDGSSFGADQRTAERNAGTALHAEEIDKVAAWADVVAGQVGIGGPLPSPLI